MACSCILLHSLSGFYIFMSTASRGLALQCSSYFVHRVQLLAVYVDVPLLKLLFSIKSWKQTSFSDYRILAITVHTWSNVEPTHKLKGKLGGFKTYGDEWFYSDIIAKIIHCTFMCITSFRYYTCMDPSKLVICSIVLQFPKIQTLILARIYN